MGLLQIDYSFLGCCMGPVEGPKLGKHMEVSELSLVAMGFKWSDLSATSANYWP